MLNRENLNATSISLLHSEFHRAADNKFRERVSRHSYDVVMLTRRGIHRHALEMPGLLDDVVKNKQIYFASAWAAYDTTRLGTLRLVPTDDVAKSLEDDYKRMSVMFFEEPPDFETLLRELGELEIQLNVGHGD